MLSHLMTAGIEHALLPWERMAHQCSHRGTVMKHGFSIAVASLGLLLASIGAAVAQEERSLISDFRTWLIVGIAIMLVFSLRLWMKRR